MAFRLSSLFPRSRSRREPVSWLDQRAERRRDSPYPAVSVTAGHPSCQAAKQLDTLRFLVGQAPGIPLPGCDVHPCECRYSHYSDRRTGRDRRVEIGGKPPQGLEERRQNHGRRAGDATR
jgi:hypothetical protein